MTERDYLEGKLWYENTQFNPNDITADKIKEVIVGKLAVPVWFRSYEFYITNLQKCIESREQNKSFYPNPLDDTYLRTYILPKMPFHNRPKISMTEIKHNWNSPEWWYENFRDLLSIIEKQYVKKKVREQLKKNKKLPKGPYHSWLTRVIQYINTHEAEFYLAKLLKFKIDESSHDSLHPGYATEDECLPDFVLDENGNYAELKICSESFFHNNYRVNLRDDFENTLQNDFHKKDGINVVGALFIIKDSPLKIYSIDLTSYEVAQHYTDKTNEVDLSDLKLILSDDKGKIPSNDWPAIPCALMFGLKAIWLK